MASNARPTIFTDREALVEELQFLVEETGEAHAVVYAGSGAPARWHAVPVSQLGRRIALVVCEPVVEAIH
ncbi:hypothetical protein ACLD0W_12695 [Alloalcanivorax sp. C16-1]|uniref:hypothetical protein n=1 Tax=Alloalcanivorax sp. C16-1 TaxID=3390051 RepID=UPI003970D50D